MNAHPNQNTIQIEADTYSEGNQPSYNVENRNGNIVVVDALGSVVATLSKGKKMSYASGIEAKFQQKRLDAIKAKKAKQSK
jgi:hypothetical protein